MLLKGTNSASRTNNSLLRSAKRKRDNEESISVDLALNDTQILSLINQPCFCKMETNCFLCNFVDETGRLNSQEAIEAFRCEREKIRTKTKEEKETFILDGMFASLSNKDKLEKHQLLEVTSSSTLKMLFQNGYGISNGRFVKCRKSWANVYGVSISILEEASKVLKKDIYAKRISHTAYNDTSLHPFNFSQVEKLIAANVRESDGTLCHNIGTYHFPFSYYFFY